MKRHVCKRRYVCQWCGVEVFIDPGFWTERQRKVDGRTVPVWVKKDVYDQRGEVVCERSQTDGQHDECDEFTAVALGRPQVVKR